jgi:chromosome partitioning protein
MALVISVVNSKGGSGKTTLATNLARAIQLDGNEVVVIDTDPQGTASDWSKNQPEGYDLPVIHVSNASLLDTDLARLTASYDVAVIDGSAKLEKGTGTCVRAADAVLIPVQPTPPDVWGVADVAGVVKRTGTPAGIVVSRAITGTNLASEIVEGLEGYDLPVFEGRTHQRVAYAEAMFSGQTVLDVRAPKAQQEVQQVATELAGLLEARPV